MNGELYCELCDFLEEEEETDSRFTSFRINPYTLLKMIRQQEPKVKTDRDVLSEIRDILKKSLENQNKALLRAGLDIEEEV